jgi:hypothetical protein
MNTLGEMDEIRSDLAQVVRLAIGEQTKDVRLFVARLVRKYCNTAPALAEQLDLYLRSRAPRRSAALRGATQPTPDGQQLPVDDESRLSLQKIFTDSPERGQPLLSGDLQERLNQLIRERRQSDRLIAMDLAPPRSAISWCGQDTDGPMARFAARCPTLRFGSYCCHEQLARAQREKPTHGA